MDETQPVDVKVSFGIQPSVRLQRYIASRLGLEDLPTAEQMADYYIDRIAADVVWKVAMEAEEHQVYREHA